jgi:hypothetical protein
VKKTPACILLLITPLVFAWGQQATLKAFNIKVMYATPLPPLWEWSGAGVFGDWGYCSYAHTAIDARIELLYERQGRRSNLLSDSVRADHKSYFVTNTSTARTDDSTSVDIGATRKRVAFTVTRVVTGSSLQRLCHRSRMLEGYYRPQSDTSDSRQVLVIHFTCESVHIQIVCDSPRPTDEGLKDDINAFVSSVRLANR